jgi:hypothetical protein
VKELQNANLKEEILRPTVLALRSVGYQLMMSSNNNIWIERLRNEQNYHLADYAEILALPGTRISPDYISLNLSEIVNYSHFAIEAYGGLYSYWIYYGDSPFTSTEKDSFRFT